MNRNLILIIIFLVVVIGLGTVLMASADSDGNTSSEKLSTVPAQEMQALKNMTPNERAELSGINPKCAACFDAAGNVIDGRACSWCARVSKRVKN